MIASATQLNRIGHDLSGLPGVHAVTDVTGFGLLGHALEVCRGSGLAAALRFGDVPLLPGVAALAEAGVGTGAATRNWASYGHEVRLGAGLPAWAQGMLCDPQTSGGLLIAVAPGAAEDVLRRCRGAGFALAAAVGTLHQGEPGVAVE
jgi:selenide,water dikinase